MTTHDLVQALAVAAIEAWPRDNRSKADRLQGLANLLHDAGSQRYLAALKDDGDALWEHGLYVERLANTYR